MLKINYFCHRFIHVNMPRKSEKNIRNKTVKAVVDGILSKKGKQIIVMDLQNIKNAVASFFIICHGTSRPQLSAIADAIEEHVREKTGFKAWNKEGFENAEWILIDYADVVVHIFQETSRKHYKLEELWADAEIQHIESDD